MKLHQKGWLLVRLQAQGASWDSELVAATLDAYGQTGVRAAGSVRVALHELAAGGLILRCAERLLQDGQRERLSFRYELSEFGRQRMRDTGLWAAAGAVPT
jgi:hypothetical protein